MDRVIMTAINALTLKFSHGKVGKPFKGSAFVAASGKLNLFIKFSFLLG
ncbi:hypothetical protein T01_1488 [Trichinella spiralis]|uniref:Uncharacterized protein n=1 Tax=Trichinella spiralis TaxID=6334 RepID=A0A0V1BCE7_TRISP|nr:hypothetical protein T01_1488 [Trichinella spiralis]